MRKFIGTLVLALAAAQAYAAPASDESIERLLVLAKAESIVDSIAGNLDQIMRQSMQAVVSQRKISPEQQRILDQLPGKFAAAMREELKWSAIKPLYLRIYKEMFDQAEIDALIAFYSSPGGQAFINKMPLVMQKSMVMAQEQMVNVAPRLNRVIEETLKEAKITPK